MSPDGAKVWFIPDAYLARPAVDDPVYKNHEAICILNSTSEDASIMLDFYFADRAPFEGVQIIIHAKRCVHVRMDDPAQVGGYSIPFDTPYGVRLRSSVPIVVQYSRMYATTHNISLMTTMAHPVE